MLTMDLASRFLLPFPAPGLLSCFRFCASAPAPAPLPPLALPLWSSPGLLSLLYPGPLVSSGPRSLLPAPLFLLSSPAPSLASGLPRSLAPSLLLHHWSIPLRSLLLAQQTATTRATTRATTDRGRDRDNDRQQQTTRDRARATRNAVTSVSMHD